MVSVERILPLSITLRPAAPRDADLLRQWRAEPSVRRFQPLNELRTECRIVAYELNSYALFVEGL